MAIVSKEVYWQQIVENPSLFGSITTSDRAFNNQAECVWQVMGDSFIRRAADWEVTRWENMLGITASGTLTARKVAVLNRMTEQTPITLRILNQLIKGVVGSDNYVFEYNNDTQTLNIEIAADLENAVRDLVSRVIPMNLNVVYEFLQLPSNYIECAFLWSNNNQYIETPEYHNDANTGFKIKAHFDTSGWKCLFASIKTGQNVPYYAQFSSRDGKIQMMLGNKAFFPKKDGSFGTAAAELNDVDYVNYNNKTLEWEVDGTDNVLRVTCEGVLSEYALPNATGVGSAYVCLFKAGRTYTNNGSFTGRLYNYQRLSADRVNENFVPALDEAGVPCLVETLENKPYYNQGTGAFVVGFTLKQARKLANLPATGGTLTVSLPSNYEGDTTVKTALGTAKNNGWNITVKVHEHDNAATASTFGLRRIWVRKTQDENGIYVDADGLRWQVDWCVTMYTPDDSTPDQHGYELFRSVEAATEYWGLTPYVDPAWEEELLN